MSDQFTLSPEVCLNCVAQYCRGKVYSYRAISQFIGRKTLQEGFAPCDQVGEFLGLSTDEPPPSWCQYKFEHATVYSRGDHRG